MVTAQKLQDGEQRDPERWPDSSQSPLSLWKENRRCVNNNNTLQYGSRESQRLPVNATSLCVGG